MEPALVRLGTLLTLTARNVALLCAALSVAIASLCCYTVDSSEFALVTEFGKSIKTVTRSGLGFKLPYQNIRRFDRRLKVYSAPSSEFLTLEKTPVVAATSILWRIADAKRFFETVFDSAGAQSRLGDILFAELGAAIGASPLNAFVSTDPQTYAAETVIAAVASKCRNLALSTYGIEVVDVQLQVFDFPKQNRERVYARMASERGRISMKYRSEGEEEGSKVRATAQSEKTKILTTALKLAEQQRGEGEAQATRIYAEALGKGPEYYRFLRTMEASKNLVPKGATMVLPADSELFGLMFDSNHYNRAGTPKSSERRPP